MSSSFPGDSAGVTGGAASGAVVGLVLCGMGGSEKLGAGFAGVSAAGVSLAGE
ncbi:MAG TPA: hypothetical protein QGF35_00585 [Dehalococcoidia bacterium]|nr:hypothetical protein [Dehalococcoidia bacterium]